MIERYLVQYLSIGGAWLDATDISGEVALYMSHEAAWQFARRFDDDSMMSDIRVVALTGES